jgi:HK97 gp10 family phage protein
MRASVKVDGMQDLQAEFEKLANPAQRKASARRALRKAAEPLAQIASGMAPRASGKLSASIGYGTRLSKRQSGLHRKMFKDDRVAVEMFVGASYAMGGGGRHAHLQEFGTGPRYHKSGKYVGQVSAQPFLRPAWDSYQATMLETIQTELWADLQRSIARAERRAARLAAKNVAP